VRASVAGSHDGARAEWSGEGLGSAADWREERVKAALVLEDGAAFEGASFGKEGRAGGVTVFYTGVVGYQEVVTNPAYRGTLAVLTYPIIGSYGVNPDDSESGKAQAAGVVIRDYSARYSNFRAAGAFEEFLVEQGVVGIRGVDTRAVAAHLRDNGEMRGAIVSGEFDAKAAASEVKHGASPFETDLAADWTINILAGPGGRKVAVLDAGATRSMYGQLADLGYRVAEAGFDARRALSAGPVGMIVAGGPGDPRAAKGAGAAVASALGRVPMLGVGLGCGLVALALGCTVSRMKVGHHGVNHSVRDTATGRCAVTAQHHSFTVEAALPKAVEATHVNVNDATVEGLRSREARAAGMQFVPGRDDNLAPSAILALFLEGGYA
jgi:carbamoyl-phosphate synthase small subunit